MVFTVKAMSRAPTEVSSTLTAGWAAPKAFFSLQPEAERRRVITMNARYFMLLLELEKA